MQLASLAMLLSLDASTVVTVYRPVGGPKMFEISVWSHQWGVGGVVNVRCDIDGGLGRRRAESVC